MHATHTENTREEAHGVHGALLKLCTVRNAGDDAELGERRKLVPHALGGTVALDDVHGEGHDGRLRKVLPNVLHITEYRFRQNHFLVKFQEFRSIAEKAQFQF